jgi:hypothetical protein
MCDIHGQALHLIFNYFTKISLISTDSHLALEENYIENLWQN